MAQNSIQILIQAQDNASKNLATVNTNVKKLGGGFKAFARQASDDFSGVADKIANFAKVAALALAGGSLGIGEFIRQASELQSIRASFESMTGSAENAAKVLKQLYKFSFSTAFSTEEINKAAQLLLGAGLRVKDLGRYMKAIGDVAGATGANLGQLTLPLSQSLARGKIQTQDFYQILNSGAGKLGQELRKELAERGMGDFNKAMEEGKVTSDILFDVIEKSAKKGGFAFQGAIKQARTFDGRMSNLMETIGNVGLEILGVDKATGEIDPQGVFAQLSNTVEDATAWLSKNKEEIKAVSKFLIENAAPAVTGLATAYAAAKLAAILFGLAAMSSNEILKKTIVGGIITLIGTLAFLQVKFNIFGKAWEMIKAVWGGAGRWFKKVIGDIIRAFEPIVKPFVAPFRAAYRTIKGVFSGIFGAIIGPFKRAFEWVKRKWDDLLKSIGYKDVKGKTNSAAQGAVGGFFKNAPIFSGVAGFQALTGKRATGGPVTAGSPYMVGEREPELFVPNQSGRILNQKQMQEAGIGSRPQINITNHIYNQLDQKAFLRDLGWRLRTAG